jgi:hypothetical protein
MAAQELQDQVIDEAAIRGDAEMNLLSAALVFFFDKPDEFFYLAKREKGFSSIKVNLAFWSKKGGKKIDSLYGRGEVDRGVPLFFITVRTAKITGFRPNECKNRELHSLFLKTGSQKNELRAYFCFGQAGQPIRL